MVTEFSCPIFPNHKIPEDQEVKDMESLRVIQIAAENKPGDKRSLIIFQYPVISETN